MTDLFEVLDGNFKYGWFLQNQAVNSFWPDIAQLKIPSC